MSAEKRRRARVQGGWANPNPGSSSVSTQVQQRSTGLQQNKFMFQETKQMAERKIPETTVILDEGTYEISKEPSGISRIHFYPHFIESSELQWMFDQLNAEIPWVQKFDIENGMTYKQPRLVAWYGEFTYAYSGVKHDPNIQWSPLLIALREQIEAKTNFVFNAMLANLYRDGKDMVAWHSDDEPELGQNPTIASLSFGETRNFELRKKPPPEDKGDYTYMKHVRIPLSPGSLLVMEGATQSDWQHRIPKEYHDRNARINLTFRTIYPS